jgi:hypothetical protein
MTKKPIFSPRDSGSLLVLSNVDQNIWQIPGWYDSLPPAMNGCLDCNTAMFVEDAKFHTTFKQTIEKLRAKYPKMPVGSYIDSHNLEDEIYATADGHDGSPWDFWKRGDPITRLPRSTFPNDVDLCRYDADAPHARAGQLVRGYAPDYRKILVRQRLVQAIHDEAVWRKNTYGVDLIFLDNWDCKDLNANPDWEGTPIPLETSIIYLEELSAAIHKEGIRLCPNFNYAVRSWDHSPTPATDLQISRIATACDAILFETPVSFFQKFGPYLTPPAPMLTPTPDDVAEMIWRYEIFNRANCPVVMAPPSIEEWKFCAGWALLLDGPLMAWPVFWQEMLDLGDAPAKLGKPIEPIAQGGITMSRRFEHGQVSVDFGSRISKVDYLSP